MFKIFKPKQQPQPSMEEQVYRDAYSAHDLLLQEAKRIIANPRMNISLAYCLPLAINLIGKYSPTRLNCMAWL